MDEERIKREATNVLEMFAGLLQAVGWHKPSGRFDLEPGCKYWRHVVRSKDPEAWPGGIADRCSDKYYRTSIWHDCLSAHTDESRSHFEAHAKRSASYHTLVIEEVALTGEELHIRLLWTRFVPSDAGPESS